jgi:hypothetical protein
VYSVRVFPLFLPTAFRHKLENRDFSHGGQGGHNAAELHRATIGQNLVFLTAFWSKQFPCLIRA